jgi:tRNA 2-thiouridine synthesizing protein E
MPAHEYAGKVVDVNEEGFFNDSSQWTPEIADAIAREVGISLTPEHWTVLSFCREDAAKQGQPPGLRRITQYAGVPMKDLYRLFPKGPGKLASRIAGLPKPKSCL